MGHDSILDLAYRNLVDIKALAERGGFKCYEIGGPLGASFCAATSRTSFVMVTVIGGGDENAVFLTAPVLKDITQDRSTILELCNEVTRDNPAYPCVLHDAQQGWDILVMQCYQRQVPLTVPDFFWGNLRNLPTVATAIGDRAAVVGLQGTPYTWDQADLMRLSIRSMA